MTEPNKPNFMAAASQYAGILSSICAVLFFLLGCVLVGLGMLLQ